MLKKWNYLTKTGFPLALCYSHFHLLEFSIKSNPLLLSSHWPPCEHTSHKHSFLHFAPIEINSTANTFLFSIDAIQLAHKEKQDLVYLDKIHSFEWFFPQCFLFNMYFV